MNSKQIISSSYSAVAATYDAAAIIEQEIGTRLLDQLANLNLSAPLRILDLGSGTSFFSKHLHTMFPQAIIINLDLAHGMLKFASNKYPAKLDQLYICADAEQLPFTDNCFDLIFANCSFTAACQFDLLFAELHRVLKINQPLLFSTFGPDTLIELGLTGTWIDMHILGDVILQTQFKNPVLDTEYIKFEYDTFKTLLQDLHESGSYQVEDINSIPNLADQFTATIEVIYGLAWGNKNAHRQFRDKEGKVYINADSIKCL